MRIDDFWGSLRMRFSFDMADVEHLNCTKNDPLGGFRPVTTILSSHLEGFLKHKDVAALAALPDFGTPSDDAVVEVQCKISHELSPELLEKLGKYTSNYGFRLLEVSQDPRQDLAEP